MCIILVELRTTETSLNEEEGDSLYLTLKTDNWFPFSLGTSFDKWLGWVGPCARVYLPFVGEVDRGYQSPTNNCTKPTHSAHRRAPGPVNKKALLSSRNELAACLER